MINRIYINGYKCLLAAKITTRKLNVFVGANASGKSSVLQTLLLLRQSAGKDGAVESLHLSGPLYEGGTVNDVLHPASDYAINIKIDTDDVHSEYVFEHDREKESTDNLRAIPAKISTPLPKCLFDRQNGFGYLNAERLGPRVTYKLPPDENELGGMVGRHGEYTTAVLARASEKIIDGWDDKLARHLSAIPFLLDGIDVSQEISDSQGRIDLLCNIFLGWIIPGSKFAATEHDQTDAAALRFSRALTGMSSTVRATHIGFGLSYTLPIITAAISLRSLEGLLIVENPEAHLHPFSQSRIGAFLAAVAATGRQIFVESHSDHVINGIRLCVSKELLGCNDVSINSFSRDPKSETTTIDLISIDASGRLGSWPRGFLDQMESDLSQL